MESVGNSGERGRIRRQRKQFDDVPALPAAGVVPVAPSFTFADDLLSEIDGLLARQDFLVGYWQAPGE